MHKLLLILLLSGCASLPHPEYPINNNNVRVQVNIVAQPINNGVKVKAFATWGKGWCVITIKESEYPACLGHEMLHCISGQWHVGENEWCKE